MKKITAFLAVALLSLALAAPAFASQSATEDAYGGTAGVQQFGGGDGNSGSSGSSTLGVLPFTGLQVGLIALAGVGLLGTGLVVRRASRHDTGA